MGLTPGLGRSTGEGKGYPLQYSGLENFVNCIVHGVAKNQTRLSKYLYCTKNSYKVMGERDEINRPRMLTGNFIGKEVQIINKQ